MIILIKYINIFYYLGFMFIDDIWKMEDINNLEISEIIYFSFIIDFKILCIKFRVWKYEVVDCFVEMVF